MNTIEEIKQIIVDNISPESIILFGSYANGDFTKDSDVDICILVNEKKGLRNISKKLYSLLINMNIPIDLIVVNSGEFNKNKNNKNLIYNDIAKGKLIYAKQ